MNTCSAGYTEVLFNFEGWGGPKHFCDRPKLQKVKYMGLEVGKQLSKVFCVLSVDQY